MGTPGQQFQGLKAVNGTWAFTPGERGLTAQTPEPGAVGDGHSPRWLLSDEEREAHPGGSWSPNTQLRGRGPSVQALQKILEDSGHPSSRLGSC